MAICAPSGPPKKELFEAGRAILAARYRVVCDPALVDRGHGYLAGDDACRRNELQRAIDDPEIRGVFCARGGYGALRIVDALDPHSLNTDPKPLCGFSDITVLLHWLYFHGVVAVHGPVVTQLPALSATDRKHLWRLLEDPTYRPCYPGAETIGRTDSAVTRTGVLWGGNLAMLCSLLGGPFYSAPRKTLLAIEEVAEPPYRLDRMITQLKRSATLDSVAGVTLGQVTAPDPRRSAKPAAQKSESWSAVLAQIISGHGRVVTRGFPWGHGRTNRAWPLGVRARLDLQTHSLQVLEPAVSAR